MRNITILHRAGLLAWGFCALCLMSGALQAQNKVERAEIFDALEAEVPREGSVTINQPEFLRLLVGNAASLKNRPQEVKPTTTFPSRRMGYRLQVYTGNLSTSKRDAQRRARAIAAQFPTERTYLHFKAPFWKLHVGNYATREEAQATLSKMRNAFPSFAAEISIVRSQIQLVP